MFREKTQQQGAFIVGSDPSFVPVMVNYHLAALVGQLLLKNIAEKGYNNPAVIAFSQQLSQLDDEDKVSLNELFVEDYRQKAQSNDRRNNYYEDERSYKY